MFERFTYCSGRTRPNDEPNRDPFEIVDLPKFCAVLGRRQHQDLEPHLFTQVLPL